MDICAHDERVAKTVLQGPNLNDVRRTWLDGISFASIASHAIMSFVRVFLSELAYHQGAKQELGALTGLGCTSLVLCANP